MDGYFMRDTRRENMKDSLKGGYTRDQLPLN
jgi:hypothetical protein